MSKQSNVKELIARDLQILMSAKSVTGDGGFIVLDGPERLALYNALRPLVMRKHKQAVKERMLAMAGAAAQMDIVDAVANDAVEGMAKDVSADIAKRRK